jgi:hypothetical protein
MEKILKPIKPNKRIVIKENSSYHFDWTSKKVSLIVFLDWIKDTIPKGAFDVTIGLENDHYYDDGITWISIAWQIEVDNTLYTIQMKKYDKQLVKWKKQNAKR